MRTPSFSNTENSSFKLLLEKGESLHVWCFHFSTHGEKKKRRTPATSEGMQHMRLQPCSREILYEYRKYTIFQQEPQLFSTPSRCPPNRHTRRRDKTAEDGCCDSFLRRDGGRSLSKCNSRKSSFLSSRPREPPLASQPSSFVLEDFS